MNKAFTRDVDREDEEDDDVPAAVLPSGAKNYVTVAGYQRLRQELMTLLDDERPKVVEVVSWAAPGLPGSPRPTCSARRA